MKNIPLSPVSFLQNGVLQNALWQSEAGLLPPKKIEIIDDRLSADAAYARMAKGAHLLWQGDWVNGRNFLKALQHRADRRLGRGQKKAKTPQAIFLQHRALLGEKAALLARFLVLLPADYRLTLRRAQAVEAACTAVLGDPMPDTPPRLICLRELLSLVSAFEWQKKGVEIPFLSAKITPHYGVFSPLRPDYLQLITEAVLPASCKVAWDIGTGTGVLAAILAKRGVARVVATEISDRAYFSAKENFQVLGLENSISLQKADLFPVGEKEKADLILFNPPWLPATPTSPIENAIYDPDSQLLQRFLNGAAAHLSPQGEVWFILSDFAVHLGLRAKDSLEKWIAAAGLSVNRRYDTPAQHPKTRNEKDPLFQFRSKEITTLWCLGQ